LRVFSEEQTGVTSQAVGQPGDLFIGFDNGKKIRAADVIFQAGAQFFKIRGGIFDGLKVFFKTF
jgi:hypothetical protein